MSKTTEQYMKNYVATLPSIEDDSNCWKHCSPCAQGIKKAVEYKECATCDFFDKNLLRDVAHSLMLNDTEIELNEYFFCN